MMINRVSFDGNSQNTHRQTFGIKIDSSIANRIGQEIEDSKTVFSKKKLNSILKKINEVQKWDNDETILYNKEYKFYIEVKGSTSSNFIPIESSTFINHETKKEHWLSFDEITLGQFIPEFLKLDKSTYLSAKKELIEDVFKNKLRVPNSHKSEYVSAKDAVKILKTMDVAKAEEECGPDSAKIFKDMYNTKLKAYTKQAEEEEKKALAATKSIGEIMKAVS
ncbi:MAG: hypothetical protein LBJ74_00615 [Heliobacteriaceae bacterium]|nr:hypothetical protein [Heliobacteriaceae bacterium]